MVQKKILEKHFFPSLNIRQAKSGVEKFSPYWGEGVGVIGGVPKKSFSKWCETHFGFGIFEIQYFFGVIGRGVHQKVNRQPGHTTNQMAGRPTDTME